MKIFYLHLDKFKFEGTKRQKEHAAGIYIVNYAAEKFYGLKNREIGIINQKPCFKYTNKLHFSISHSKNTAAACFDSTPIGFDIEFIKPRDYRALTERMQFKLKEDTLEEFYRCWTIYEAEYKLQMKAECLHTDFLCSSYIYTAASAAKTEPPALIELQTSPNLQQ